MSLELPLSARLAWWLTAWLRGAEVTDHVLDAVTDGNLAHTVDGLSGGTAMLDLLLEARRSGATGAGLALPVEGDLLYSDDLDATVTGVRAAGGTVTEEPYDFPGGRRFIFTDNSGNQLGVWSSAH